MNATVTKRPASTTARLLQPAESRSVAGSRGPETTRAWLRAQVINVTRHAEALRPFRPDEFGSGAAAPSPGHIQSVNMVVQTLGKQLNLRTDRVRQAAQSAAQDPTPQRLREVVVRGESAHQAVRASEQVWDWYFEFFGQRQSRYADWLLACDRIALDMYQDVYMGLGRPASIPAPAPMAYMRTGFSPATFRRNVRLQRLGHQLNPFPIVQIPYHRMVNPWTLGAILHEISHNIQNEVGLATSARDAASQRLAEAKMPSDVVQTWARWHRETFADLLGLLLGGPSIVASLIDILARAPATVTTYSPGGVHPLPLLRARISTELLERMGFIREARRYRQLWDKTYSGIEPAAPVVLLETASRCIPLVVDTLCFTPYRALGGIPLSQVFMFSDKHEAMVVEAGERLAKGIDPGIVPERFLIGAARHALDHGLASPDRIAAAFYRDLARR
jgi:hypothetical protein